MISGEIQEGSNNQAQERIQDNHTIPHGSKLVRIVPYRFDKDNARM